MGIGSGEECVADHVMPESQEEVEARALQVLSKVPLAQQLADAERVLKNWRTKPGLKNLPEAPQRIATLEATIDALRRRLGCLSPAKADVSMKEGKTQSSAKLVHKKASGARALSLPKNRTRESRALTRWGTNPRRKGERLKPLP